MKDMTKTASRLDTLMKILQILLDIAIVTSFVGLGILAAAHLLKLLPEQFGTGFNSITIADFLELTVAPEYVPDTAGIIRTAAITIALSLIPLFVLRRSLKYVREILKPMASGQPFHNIVSTNLKKLALCSIVYYLAINAASAFTSILSFDSYSLRELLLSDKIVGVTLNYEWDLSFLILSGFLMLLSYVFRYGEELQQLSDETL